MTSPDVDDVILQRRARNAELRSRSIYTFDAEYVASKLSKPQADAVLRGGISDEGPITIKILLDKMLFYREPTPNTTCYGLELTQFGKSVRACLQEKPR